MSLYKKEFRFKVKEIKFTEQNLQKLEHQIDLVISRLVSKHLLERDYDIYVDSGYEDNDFVKNQRTLIIEQLL